MFCDLDQLRVTLQWATWCADAKVDKDSLIALERQYTRFCEDAEEAGLTEEACFTGGDWTEQLAHDYVLTRMRSGVGFWEASDWCPVYGQVLCRLCEGQGTIEPYLGDDGVLYVNGCNERLPGAAR